MINKKSLRSQSAQSVLEYTLIFLVITGVVVAVFLSIRPESTKLKASFDKTINDSIAEINNND